MASESQTLLTVNGKPFALVTPVTETTVEETAAAIRRVRAEFAVSEIQQRAAKKGLDALTDDDIQAIVGKVRGSRRR